MQSLPCVFSSRPTVCSEIEKGHEVLYHEKENHFDEIGICKKVTLKREEG